MSWTMNASPFFDQEIILEVSGSSSMLGIVNEELVQ